MNLLLDSHGNLPIEDYFPSLKRRLLHVVPEGGYFDHKDFLSAARAARTGDCIFVPSGEFPVGDFSKPMEIAGLHGSQACLIPKNNRMKVSADVIFFRNLTLGQEGGEPLKIAILRGMAVFMDCQIHGEIEVEGAETEVALTRCRLSGGTTGIQLKKGAAAMLHSSAIERYTTGIRVEDSGRLEVRFGRFAHCRSNSPENPGQGIQSGNGALTLIGTRFVDNDIGITLRHPQSTDLFNSTFSSQGVTSLLIEGHPESGGIRLTNCKFQNPGPGDYAQIEATAIDLELNNCELTSSSAIAICSRGGKVGIRECRLKNGDKPLLQMENTELSVENSRLESANRLLQISGETFHFKDCAIQGDLLENGQPLAISDSPHFSNCHSLLQPSVPPEQEPLNEFLDALHALAGLTNVKPQAEQILRELQGNRICQQAGQAIHLAPIRLFMAGDTGCGRSTLTELLIQAFVRYGVLNQSRVVECSFHDLLGYDEPALRLLAESVRGGTLVVRRNAPIPRLPEPQRGLIPDRRIKLKRLNELVGSHGAIIVHGDRTLLRQLLAGDESLRQVFRTHLEFAPYHAAELAAITLQLCEKHHLRVSDECALKFNIGFHVTQDRKDRRFQDASGAETLFRGCQTRQLERVSLTGKIDPDLLPEDIHFPYDRTIAEILCSSPGFEIHCPNCESQNPWQVGLPERLICESCGKLFQSRIGIWQGRYSEIEDDEEPPQPGPRQRFTHRRIADVT